MTRQAFRWKLGITTMGLLSFALLAEQAQAQVTVQLPTLRTFSIRTVVSAPDGGSMSLGGIKRSASGQVSRGVPGLSGIPGVNRLFKNRAIGRDSSTSNGRVHVQIISMREMEEQLLAESRARDFAREANNPNGPAEIRRKAEFISRNVGRRRR